VILGVCLIVAIILSVTVIIDNGRRENFSKLTEAANFQEGNRYDFLDTIDYNNLQIADLIINGNLEKYDSCYQYNDSFYVPLEKILSDIGINYTFNEADGEIDFQISDLPVQLILGDNKLIYNNGEYSLKLPAVIISGKIYVTTDLFDNIKSNTYSYSFVTTDINKTYYFNFFPNEKYSGMNDKKFVFATGSGARYTTLFDYINSVKPTAGQSVTVPDTTPEIYANCSLSPSGNYVLASDGKQTRLLSSSDPSQGILIAEETGYAWSLQGDYAYKFEYSDFSLNIYDPAKNLFYKYKNILKSVLSSSGVSEAEFSATAQSYLLQKYQRTSSFESVILKSSKDNDSICSISGKVISHGKSVMGEIFNGRVACSPDLTKISYYYTGDGYYISNADGTKKIEVGAVKDLTWISNKKLSYIDQSGNMVVYDILTNKKTSTGDGWRYVSSSTDGNSIYYVNRDVYLEDAKKVQLVGTLPWDCEYTYLPSGAQYMLNVSLTDGGSVYVEKNGELQYITSKDKLIYNKNGITPEEKYKSTFVYFKAQGVIGILINENGRIGMIIVDFSGQNKNINTYYFDSVKSEDNPKISFMSDNAGETVLFYNSTVVLFKEEAKIFVQKMVIDGAKALYIGS
jgi:hypothetical protein